MEPDDLLCSRNVRPEKALAWANGTSQRADGWAGEKAARSGSSIRPPCFSQVVLVIVARSLTGYR